jgi:photoactive yellow protein
MDTNGTVSCAWCGAGDDGGSGTRSHGICPACFETIVGTPLLDEADLDSLPFGLIEIDPDGTVLRYNSTERALSGKSVDDVIGRNFFAEVAPCTRVREFQGRVAPFLASNSEPETFRFSFPFPTGTVNVTIAFVRTGHGTVFVMVKSQSD